MTSKLLLTLTVILALACSTSGEITQVDKPDGLADAQAEAVAELTSPVDTAIAETVDVPLIFEAVDSAPDIPFQECLPGEGCFLDPCAGNGECQAGWCVQHLGENVCSQTCQDECPPGWQCQQVAGSDPDVVYICVSNFANLCRPCTTNVDCTSTGGADDACLDYGPGGNFCGGACSGDGECPWGFSCQESETVQGATLLQCVNDTGDCPCTASSAALGLATSCAVTSEFGECVGSRVCTFEGLSDCDAPVPGPESCNGLDDNCDGDVDEPTLVGGNFVNLCDDGNACTADSCAGAEGCLNETDDLLDCSDTNPCTVADHCVDGTCIGDPVQCDDENPCTDNVCTATGGCEYPALPGPCDDGNPCTVGDQCLDTVCTGTAVSCDCQQDSDCGALEDGDLCNGTLYCDQTDLPFQCRVEEGTEITCALPEGIDAPCLEPFCDPATGDCSFVPAHDSWACNDNDPCTILETCSAGECSGGSEANCNDGNLCTDDSCDPLVGCVHTPNADQCNDGNVCTTGDICSDGICSGPGELVCDDSDICNGTESCDPAVGCVKGEAPVCDDGDACNGTESCDPAAGCVAGVAPVCDDNNICTNDSCHPQQGCVFESNQIECDDGNACTVGDLCKDSMCISAGQLNCDDENLCTDDLCSPDEGCFHLLNSAPCDDDDLCTTGDHCALGECLGSGTLPCNDNNPCTDDSCEAKAGCTFTPNDAECEDGSACTTGDHCANGQCVIAAILNCDDGNICTDDTCDPQTGCINEANTAPCSDGTVCTINDTCADKACVSGPPLNCNDGNVCTDDTCDALVGCINANNSADCNDANACTPFDKCAAGTCVGSGAVDCNDNNLCTDDSCSPLTGCLNAPNTVPCDDDSACTVGDACAASQCVGGPALDCDDANACTTDDCTPDSGCTHVPLPDNTECGGGNLCKEGACVPPCTPGSTTLAYTGSQQNFTVPQACKTLTIEAWGAQGAAGAGGATGGLGGLAKGSLTVQPAATLYVYVGGQAGAFNGGGNGGSAGGGKGGGASDVRYGGNGSGNRVLVAGGGGGGGGRGCSGNHVGGNGGAGGGGTGGKGANSPNGGGGFGGSPGAGGARGVGCNYALGDNGNANGTGGNGQTCCCGTQPGGGGGGAGYVQGGGGGGGSAGTTGCSGNDKGGGGGGGGGTSYTGGMTANTSTQNGVRSGHGEVKISWSE